jgi:hypothetical protein
MIITIILTAFITTFILFFTYIVIPHLIEQNTRLKEQKMNNFKSMVEQIIDDKLKEILND